jgi:putative RNA 2'-phosphotransferase
MTNLKSLSKFISLVLRHRPEEFGLTLDSDGFAPFDALLTVVKERFSGEAIRQDVESVIAGDEHGKKRFEMIDGRVRAVFGHSTGTPQIIYPSVQPPEVLYHGTVRRFARQILLEGLKPQTRQYVHLTTNREEAERVGRRHGRDFVLLTIRALDAHGSGVTFFQADDERFLVNHIPPEFIADE